MPDTQELERCAETGVPVPHNEIVRVSGPGLRYLDIPDGAVISASIIRQSRMIHRVLETKRKQQAELELRLAEETAKREQNEFLPNIS